MGTIINSSLRSQLRERFEPNRVICFPRQISSKGGGQNNPVFEVSVSKLEGLAGWDLGSPGKAAVGHGHGLEELQSPSGCSSSWVVVAAGHGAGNSRTKKDFKKKLLSLKIPAPGVLLLPQT